MFLFDEPLSNLDAKLRVEMRTQIKRLHAMLGTTTIYVTHGQIEAMTLADRVLILRAGELVQQGPPVEVYENPNCRFVGEFIGSPQMNILDGVLERAGERPALRLAGSRIPLSEIDLPDGMPLHVGIRPEHLSWTDQTPILRPTLDVSEPLGSDTMAICLLGEEELTARLDPRVRLERSVPVPLTFEGANMHLFDPDTGARVPFRA